MEAGVSGIRIRKRWEIAEREATPEGIYLNRRRFLRAAGFSSAPGLIRVLGIIPPIQNVVFFVSSLWMLVAVVIAIRQSLNYGSTGRAIAVCAIGFVVQLFAFGFLINLLGGSIRGI